MEAERAPGPSVICEWFGLFEYRVAVAELKRFDTHDVRIGRAPDDWWIEINHEAHVHPRDEDWDQLPEDLPKQFRKLREAIVLVSIFAKVDYDSWLAELIRSGFFKLRKGMDLSTHRLPCKWSIWFGNKDPPAVFQWTMLRNLLGFGSLSKEFKRDFARVSTLALEKGIDVRCMAPIPIHFQFTPSPARKSTSQVKAIQGLTQTVAELRAIEAKNAEQRREPSSRFPPAFRIERLELDFRFFMLDTALLAEIQQFLESDVRIHTLTLPEFPFEPIHDVATWLPVWGCLLPKLIGNSATPSVVRRLVIPTTYCEGILMPSLMSALQSATGIEYIQLECIEHRRINDRINWRLWAWLGFALVSGATLEFSGRLNEHCVRALRQVKEATNLLSCLWRTCAEQEAPVSSPSLLVSQQPATVLKGSMLFPQHCGQASGCFEAMNDIQGVLVPDDDEADEASHTVALMLPGYGFCTVERASLQNKRQRISDGQYPQSDAATPAAGPNLQAFIINFTGNRGLGCPAKPHIVELLGILGSTLTSLAIRAEDIDDEVLQAGLLLCPRLKNIRLDDLPIQTVRPLLTAYRHGIQIRSLDLHALSLPPEAFESFLEALGADPSLQCHLERLRFGCEWKTYFRDRTRIVCEQMLKTNRHLQYVHAHQRGYCAVLRLEDSHHNVLMPRPANRLAFLSVLRHLQTSIVSPSEEYASERRVMIDQPPDESRW